MHAGGVADNHPYYDSKDPLEVIYKTRFASTLLIYPTCAHRQRKMEKIQIFLNEVNNC